MQLTRSSAFGWGRWVIRIAGLAIILAYVGQFFDRPGGISEGQQAPTFRAELSDGSTLDLEGGPGAPLVLSFWASWCGPCKREAPILNHLHNDGVKVVGVSMDDLPPARAAAAAREMGMHFPVIAGRDDIPRRFLVQAVPTTYVIAADGSVLLAHQGVVTTEALRDALGTTAGERHADEPSD